jgi:hypothetical protein
MADQLLQAVKIVENQLDAAIDRLDNLDDDELEKIRKNRIESMMTMEKQKIEWRNLGTLFAKNIFWLFVL